MTLICDILKHSFKFLNKPNNTEQCFGAEGDHLNLLFKMLPRSSISALWHLFCKE